MRGGGDLAGLSRLCPPLQQILILFQLFRPEFAVQAAVAPASCSPSAPRHWTVSCVSTLGSPRGWRMLRVSAPHPKQRGKAETFQGRGPIPSSILAVCWRRRESEAQPSQTFPEGQLGISHLLLRSPQGFCWGIKAVLAPWGWLSHGLQAPRIPSEAAGWQGQESKGGRGG